jgi:hypothetical protein
MFQSLQPRPDRSRPASAPMARRYARAGPTKPFGHRTKPFLAGNAVSPKRMPGRMVAIDQTGGFGHVGAHQFDLSGILLRAVAGNAKQPSPCLTASSGALGTGFAGSKRASVEEDGAVKPRQFSEK